MTTTIGTEHTNELILVEEVIDAGGGALVALGLVNQDGSDTFPGRTLTPDQAEELAASLALSAAVARASAGLAEAPSGGEQAHAETLIAIRAAVPLSGSLVATEDGSGEGDTTTAPQPAASAAAVSGRASATGSGSGTGASQRNRRQRPRRRRSAEPEELPIDGYDELKAAMVSKRLAGLSAAQLGRILAYEQEPSQSQDGLRADHCPAGRGRARDARRLTATATAAPGAVAAAVENAPRRFGC